MVRALDELVIAGVAPTWASIGGCWPIRPSGRATSTSSSSTATPTSWQPALIGARGARPGRCRRAGGGRGAALPAPGRGARRARESRLAASGPASRDCGDAGSDRSASRPAATASESWTTAGRCSSPGPRRAIWSSSPVRAQRRFARARLAPRAGAGSRPNRAAMSPLRPETNAAAASCSIWRPAPSGRRAAPSWVMRSGGSPDSMCPTRRSCPRTRTLEYRTKITLHADGEAGNRAASATSRPDADLRRSSSAIITVPELMALWATLRRCASFLPAASPGSDPAGSTGAGDCHVVVRARSDAARWCGPTRSAELARGAASGDDLVAAAEGGAPRAVAGAGEAFPATVFEQVHPRDGRLGSATLPSLSWARRPTDECGISMPASARPRLRSRAPERMVESVESDRRAVAEAEAPGRRHGAMRLGWRTCSAAGASRIWWSPIRRAPAWTPQVTGRPRAAAARSGSCTSPAIPLPWPAISRG